jgi:hypothetical protein
LTRAYSDNELQPSKGSTLLQKTSFRSIVVAAARWSRSVKTTGFDEVRRAWIAAPHGWSTIQRRRPRTVEAGASLDVV